MKQITANIKVIVHPAEDEELGIDAICLPLEEQGWCIQSAFTEEEN